MPIHRTLLVLVLLSTVALASSNPDPSKESALVADEPEQHQPGPADQSPDQHHAHEEEIFHDYPDEVFKRMDRNHDGGLIDTEITDDEFLHFFGAKWTDPREAIATMDSNKDGKLDLEEFLAYTEPIIQVSYAKNDFAHSDWNKDGSLNFTEYQMSGHSMEDGVPAPGEELHTEPRYVLKLKAGFNGMDTNKDEKISLEEYVALQGRESFARKDADSDGKISKKEFIDFEKRTGMSEHLSSNWFQTLDKDHNGWLSRVEDRGEEEMDGDYEDYEDYDHESQSAIEGTSQESDTLGEIDINDDGFISWDEYKADQPELDAEGEKEQLAKDFAAFDTDGDGKISHAEYMRYEEPGKTTLSDL